ncbi:TIGR00153 family protein [Amphritea sp. 2_MG-2023]|jgi:predicted phosphate transport protein (TIGR00153 family)|uniref:TIGR00153 family protein n=1 Tax=Amphritea TaxID=515417 RepID=UPI001C066BB9|nr:MULTISPECIES: TIGR00153 family protein [Amphritea]MBU2965666.1 TIGR00153 family protein [Amphritea atlantica]MDO6417222.1 TIGR00153 family protein [Amphritea sp. 2_MG-2023]MDX2423224.1 TIGR00153 family protein [Amphritea sp.]
MVTNNPILQMFARSPFQPMQEHIAKAHSCAIQLIPFFDAVMAEDWDKAAEVQHSIAVLEGEADSMKKEIRMNLPNSLFLPVPRTDLLELLRMQDKIANRSKDIAGLMLGRKMSIPTQIQPAIAEYIRSSLRTSGQALIALNELDELITAGFRGHEVDVVEKMIHDLDDMEHDADEMEREVRSSLFDVEKDLHPIDAMFLYQIITWIGDLADKAQQVGSRLQLLLAK